MASLEVVFVSIRYVKFFLEFSMARKRSNTNKHNINKFSSYESKRFFKFIVIGLSDLTVKVL